MDQYRIGPIIWGSLLIWIGIMGVVDERAGVASIGAGAILLAGALWRRSVGRRAGFILSVMGILLVLLGINDWNGDDRGIPLFSTALIAVGALIVTKAIGLSRKVQKSGFTMEWQKLGAPPRPGQTAPRGDDEH